MRVEVNRDDGFRHSLEWERRNNVSCLPLRSSQMLPVSLCVYSSYDDDENKGGKHLFSLLLFFPIDLRKTIHFSWLTLFGREKLGKKETARISPGISRHRIIFNSDTHVTKIVHQQHFSSDSFWCWEEDCVEDTGTWRKSLSQSLVTRVSSLSRDLSL